MKKLTLLEMMRLATIVVFQRKLFGEIRVALRPEAQEPREAPLDGGGGPRKTGRATLRSHSSR